jgi:hypothetical protein
MQNVFEMLKLKFVFVCVLTVNTLADLLLADYDILRFRRLGISGKIKVFAHLPLPRVQCIAALGAAACTYIYDVSLKVRKA